MMTNASTKSPFWFAWQALLRFTKGLFVAEFILNDDEWLPISDKHTAFDSEKEKYDISKTPKLLIKVSSLDIALLFPSTEESKAIFLYFILPY